MKKSRSKAFFISGGAGRVICSIPAFERYAKDSGDKDFIIVCEGGMDFYRGHTVLQKHAYEVWHKGLFDQHLRDKDIVTPEPYRINEYFNQECSLAQAFDIEINSLEEPRELPAPSINLNKTETITGYQAIQGIKSQLNKDKAIIVQPFGRSVTQMGEYLIDSTSRSFEVGNIVSIIEQLRDKYAVVMMADLALPIPENKEHPVAMPREPNLRLWASMINSAEHFLGCDSVGQHIAKALDKTATVVIGSTVPINISYLNDEKFDIIIESVSAIAKQVAEVSPWYNNNIPCEAGDDGTLLITSILKSAKRYLKKDGKHIEIDSYGSKREVTYKDGKLNGKFIDWYDNGNKRKEGNYKTK